MWHLVIPRVGVSPKIRLFLRMAAALLVLFNNARAEGEKREEVSPERSNV